MTQVKLCGITNAEDYRLASQAGADYLGCLVNIPESPRSLSLEQAVSIRAESLANPTQFVVLQVNPSLAELEALVATLEPAVLQLHGEETPAFCRQVRQFFAGEVWKALRIGGEQDVEAIAAYNEVADRLVLDARVQGQRGGTGESFDWSLVAQVNHVTALPLIIAGGLSPANVQGCLAATEPWGVDVSSGVERSPGHKDPQKVQDFIQQVRGYRRS